MRNDKGVGRSANSAASARQHPAELALRPTFGEWIAKCQAKKRHAGVRVPVSPCDVWAPPG